MLNGVNGIRSEWNASLSTAQSTWGHSFSVCLSEDLHRNPTRRNTHMALFAFLFFVDLYLRSALHFVTGLLFLFVQMTRGQHTETGDSVNSANTINARFRWAFDGLSPPQIFHSHITSFWTFYVHSITTQWKCDHKQRHDVPWLGNSQECIVHLQWILYCTNASWVLRWHTTTVRSIDAFGSFWHSSTIFTSR